MNAIASKMERYKDPWHELKIQYGNTKGKAFTEEEDRFMICAMHKLGYGAWYVYVWCVFCGGGGCMSDGLCLKYRMCTDMIKHHSY